jgi:hypothetical protein
MKKSLLVGTTALIAAGVATSGVVQAAEEPITVGISGYMRTAMAVISEDSGTGELAAGRASHTMGKDMEVTVSGSTTLDNGLTVGVQGIIDDATADFDEEFIFFRGSFGQIRIGNTESARQQLSKNTPTGNWNYGINSPFFIFGNGGSVVFVRTGDDGLGNDDSLKVVYFSPTFNGLRLAGSYSPDGNANGVYGGNARDATALATQNEASAAIEFSQNMGDFSLSAAAGYETYVVGVCGTDAATIACDSSPSSVQFGAAISFGEFSIGGEWQQSDQILNSANGSANEREDLALGILWSSGQYIASLNWAQAEADQATDDTDTLEIWRVMGTYVVGPGVNIGAGIGFGEFDDATAGGLDNSYTTGVVTANVSF